MGSKSKNSSTKLLVSLTVLLCFLVTIQLSYARYLKRSTGSQVCSQATPCGWQVYRPFTRTLDYFVRSPCQCSSGTRCVRTADDISITAYVYRCRTEAELPNAELWPFRDNSATAENENP